MTALMAHETLTPVCYYDSYFLFVWDKWLQCKCTA